MTVPLLEVKNLCKYFPIYSGLLRKQVGVFRAVDGIDYTIFPGETLGIVGESGSGKSTAVKASLRLTEPTAGEVLFKGEDILSLSKRALQPFRKEVQIVFQDPYASLNPRKTILDAIGEALRFHSIVHTNREKIEHVADALEKVGLSPDVMHRYPHQFSGGQQQRICIGRALSLNPSLIICDEAVSALDVSVQAQILNLLLELKEKFHLSYLFVSHDLSVVRYFCDKIHVFHRGKVVESGESEALFQNPTNAYTKKLLSSIPVNHPHLREQLADLN